MSTIAPKFRLGYFIKSITDNMFWAIVLVTLAGIPIMQIALFYIDLPVVDGLLVNPFLALTLLAHPEIALPSCYKSCHFKSIRLCGFFQSTMYARIWI